MRNYDFCESAYGKLTPACHVKDAVNAVRGAAQVIDFAKDPLGYVAQKEQEAALGLTDAVLPQMEKLTHPDLTQAWFIDAYRVSFACALFLFVGLLGWNFVQLGRRRVSGDEVMETLALYTPLALGGMVFGPLAGQGLLRFTGAFTTAITGWGITGTAEDTTAQLQKAIDGGDPGGIAGGEIVALIVFFCLVVALLMAFLALLVMMVTLYMTGALIPLSLVWLVHPRQRSKGLKLVMVWVGICFSHVLLFFTLGLAFHMIQGMATFDSPGLQVLSNLSVAVIALLMATLSPVALLKFAPVGPSTSAAGGPALSLPRSSSAPAGPYYPESDSDSQTAQLARSSDSADIDTDGDVGSSGGGGGGGGGGGLLSAFAASRASRSSSASMESDENGGAGTGGGFSSSGSSASEPLAAEGSSAGDGTAALADKGQDATKAGGKLQAAGLAADATGVGAPIGVALQAAGTAMQVTGAVASATAGIAQSAGDMAAEHMDHDVDNQGADGADTRPRR